MHVLTEITEEGPDAHLALKLLEKFDENWRPKLHESSKETDPRTDTGDEGADKRDPLEQQLEGLKKALEELDSE